MGGAASASVTGWSPPGARAWRAWFGGGAIAVVDQGCFAGATFALNVLLARGLPPAGYGAFTAASSAYLLIAAVQSALLVEPLSIYGAGRWRPSFAGYLATVRRGQRVATLALGAGAAAAAVALAWSSPRLAGMLAGVAAMVVGHLSLLLMRAATYARGRPAWSAAASAAYALGTIGLIAALDHAGRLSAATGLGAAALAAGLAAAGLARAHATAGDGAAAPPAAPTIVAEHLRYGRWALGTCLIGWLCSNLQYLVLGGTGGLAAMGSLRALDILLLPFLQFMTAVGQFCLPRVATRADDPRAVGRLCLAVGGACLVLAAGVYAALVLGREAIAPLLIGRAIAGPVAALIGLYALAMFPYTASQAALIGLRALTRSDLVFAYHLAFAAVFAVACGLGARHGVAGVAAGSVAAQALMAVFAAAALAWATRRPAAGGAPC